MDSSNHSTEQLAKVDKVLDEYEISVGLPDFNEGFREDSAQKYLHLTRTQIEKLTPDECGEAALLLASLSFYLQRSYNREVARVHWAEQILKSTVAGREGNYKGSWDSQFNQAVKDDSYTSKVADIKRYAQQRADRMTNLSYSVKNIGDIFLSVQRSKGLKYHG